MLTDEVRGCIETLCGHVDHESFMWEIQDVRYRVIEWLNALPQPPQPNWDDAPEWAMWATIATNRAYKPFRFCWVYHASEPLDADSRGWMMKKGSPRTFGEDVDIPIGIDYRTLKQRRPEAT